MKNTFVASFLISILIFSVPAFADQQGATPAQVVGNLIVGRLCFFDGWCQTTAGGGGGSTTTIISNVSISQGNGIIVSPNPLTGTGSISADLNYLYGFLTNLTTTNSIYYNATNPSNYSAVKQMLGESNNIYYNQSNPSNFTNVKQTLGETNNLYYNKSNPSNFTSVAGGFGEYNNVFYNQSNPSNYTTVKQTLGESNNLFYNRSNPSNYTATINIWAEINKIFLNSTNTTPFYQKNEANSVFLNSTNRTPYVPYDEGNKQFLNITDANGRFLNSTNTTPYIPYKEGNAQFLNNTNSSPFIERTEGNARYLNSSNSTPLVQVNEANSRYLNSTNTTPFIQNNEANSRFINSTNTSALLENAIGNARYQNRTNSSALVEQTGANGIYLNSTNTTPFYQKNEANGFFFNQTGGTLTGAILSAFSGFFGSLWQNGVQVIDTLSCSGGIGCTKTNGTVNINGGVTDFNQSLVIFDPQITENSTLGNNGRLNTLLNSNFTIKPAQWDMYEDFDNVTLKGYPQLGKQQQVLESGFYGTSVYCTAINTAGADALWGYGYDGVTTDQYWNASDVIDVYFKMRINDTSSFNNTKIIIGIFNSSSNANMDTSRFIGFNWENRNYPGGVSLNDQNVWNFTLNASGNAGQRPITFKTPVINNTASMTFEIRGNGGYAGTTWYAGYINGTMVGNITYNSTESAGNFTGLNQNLMGQIGVWMERQSQGATPACFRMYDAYAKVAKMQ